MREIKFRAWSPSKNKMIDDVFSACDLWGDYIFNGSSILERRGPAEGEWTEKTDFIVMQFTGLYDKNGTEIYEGDLLSVGKHFDRLIDKMRPPLAVEWINDGAYWAVRGRSGLSGLLHHIKNPKIIGNIYETPSLQEVKS